MARKSSLREFQRSVAERLRDPSKLRATSSKLGFQVADENWFVSLADVAEVIPVPQFVPVPQTQRWFQGVANVRGVRFLGNKIVRIAQAHHPTNHNARRLKQALMQKYDAALSGIRCLGNTLKRRKVYYRV